MGASVRAQMRGGQLLFLVRRTAAVQHAFAHLIFHLLFAKTATRRLKPSSTTSGNSNIPSSKMPFNVAGQARLQWEVQ